MTILDQARRMLDPEPCTYSRLEYSRVIAGLLERQERLEQALEKIRVHAAAEVGWFAGYAGEVANDALREREMSEGGGE